MEQQSFETLAENRQPSLWQSVPDTGISNWKSPVTNNRKSDIGHQQTIGLTVQRCIHRPPSDVSATGTNR